jgi:hypothetical protein
VKKFEWLLLDVRSLNSSGVRLADECQPANATTFLEIGLASNLVSSLGRQLPIHMQK